MGDMTMIAPLSGDGSIPAYVATPAGKPRAAIMVVPEVFGVNAGIRAKVDAFATDGYLALAHDMFWRTSPGKQLDPDAPGHLEEAIGDMKRFDMTQGVADIEALIRDARERAGGRKVGVVGFCIGGLMTYLAATRTDTDASVGYYGGGIDNFLGESHAIANPLMLHFAEKDGFIGPEARAKVHAALDASPHATIHDYPGVDHGFATSFGKRRDEAAAALADARTAAFFAKHLG